MASERVIKFRVWDKDVKKIEPVGAIDWDGNYKVVTCNTEENKHYMTELNQFILMQFTGLLDKNGKEIYEGDIVAVPFFRDKTLGNIKFACAQFYIEWSGQRGKNTQKSLVNLCYEKKIEVAGNIYENLELTNGSK